MNIQRGNISIYSYGTIIEATVDVELDEAHEYSFIIRKPSGVTLTVEATITNGNVAQYTIQDGDIDEVGIWYAYLRNDTFNSEYQPVQNSFSVRPQAEDM
jgi:hypothetical protein